MRWITVSLRNRSALPLLLALLLALLFALPLAQSAALFHAVRCGAHASGQSRVEHEAPPGENP